MIFPIVAFGVWMLLMAAYSGHLNRNHQPTKIPLGALAHLLK